MARLFHHLKRGIDRQRQRERQYGWLFPALAPFCLVAAVVATLGIPAARHWTAVQAVEQRGASFVHDFAFAPWMPPTLRGEMRLLFSTTPAVTLDGPAFSEHDLRLLTNLRGLREVTLAETAIDEAAIERFRRRHPNVTIKLLSFAGAGPPAAADPS